MYDCYTCFSLFKLCIALTIGLAAVVAKCQAGFYCPAGSHQSTEVVCPQGSYCPQGSAIPSACPNGTFSNHTALTAAADCTACLKGYYCNGFGLTTVSGPCRSGKWLNMTFLGICFPQKASPILYLYTYNNQRKFKDKTLYSSTQDEV